MKNNKLEEPSDVYSKVTSQVIFKMMLEQGTNFIDMRKISRPQIGKYNLHSKCLKLQLHDAINRLRLYLNSLTRVLSVSNSHSDVASIQKNRGDKSHRVIV